jgi:fatty-acyl-CoA synthase
MTGAASRIPLSPLSLLARTVSAYPNREAVVHGHLRLTWSQFHDEVQRLAASLVHHGLKAGDRVAFLSPNTPPMLAAHFGVALAQGVLVALNFRLHPSEILYVLQHANAKFIVVDKELAGAIAAIRNELDRTVKIIVIDDGANGAALEAASWSEFLGSAPREIRNLAVDDDEKLYALNYTSGTTGRPKGVMYTHRGAYTHAIGEIIEMGLTVRTRYLWTLPMFHCNGWGYTWAVTGVGGVHVCLRKIDPGAVFDIIERERISHLCGAPTVLIMMAGADPGRTRTFGHDILIVMAGAAPSPAIIAEMEARGARVAHVYGLTETYGPHTICAWNPEWDSFDAAKRAELRARQGVPYVGYGEVRVVDAQDHDVTADGETLGEVIMRGNNVMTGYFNDEDATRKAVRNGWFYSGDLAVMHPSGHIQVRDRLKDIIISGGENISSIEVENTLYRHPAVLEVAVVAQKDEKWGEVPAAFVHLRDGASVSEEQLAAFCRDSMAGYKCPKSFIFGPLPKTGTGKIKKYELRQRLG